MKIIIEVDGAHEQPEVKKVSRQEVEQQSVINAPVSNVSSSSGINAGEPRVSDNFKTDPATADIIQSFLGNSSLSTPGAIDAGAAKVQDVNSSAVAMPDTGNMETFNTANAFSAGPLANAVSN